MRNAVRTAGRPSRVPGKPTKMVGARMTEEEREDAQRAADRADMTMSEWLRDVAMSRARQRRKG